MRLFAYPHQQFISSAEQRLIHQHVEKPLSAAEKSSDDADLAMKLDGALKDAQRTADEREMARKAALERNRMKAQIEDAEFERAFSAKKQFLQSRKVDIARGLAQLLDVKVVAAPSLDLRRGTRSATGAELMTLDARFFIGSTTVECAIGEKGLAEFKVNGHDEEGRGISYDEANVKAAEKFMRTIFESTQKSGKKMKTNE